MSKIAWAIIIIIIVGGLIYVAATREKPSQVEEPAPEENKSIQVLFPKGGEELEVGKSYEIQWENYKSAEPLSIGLQTTTTDNKVYLKKIAENIQAATSGVYTWTVTSEPVDSKYKIEVYPEGNRPLVGRSKDFFSIIGESLIMVDTPQPLEEIASPVKVAGKARQVFSEGEIIIRLTGYDISEEPKFAEAAAKAQDCDWMGGDWCDFEAELAFDSEQMKSNTAMLEFYQKDEKSGDEKLIYNFPVSVETMPVPKAPEPPESE